MSKNTNLRKYFPMIKEREQIQTEIESNHKLASFFYEWKKNERKEFLDFCSGVKGVKILYDSFFKEIMNPEYAPERLNDLLSNLIGQKVKIISVLPNDSTRIADEHSLLIMDILVKLEDGSLANCEAQKLGYMFGGQRAACYSSDLLLRQYRRIRGERNENKEKFSYKDIKSVYTIIFFEKSPIEIQNFAKTQGLSTKIKNCKNNSIAYIHRFKQKSDTGLEMNFLQEYILISLDIFKEIRQNKSINNKTEAWLTFFGTDEPEKIVELITTYPEFKKMYEDIYNMCLNIEKVIGMFSKELLQLDKNTVEYMIDEMQNQISGLQNENSGLKGENLNLKGENSNLKGENSNLKDENSNLKDTISHKNEQLSRQEMELQQLREQLHFYQEKNKN